MTNMKVIWNPDAPEEWVHFHRRHHGSLQQSWAYGQALSQLGVTVHRAQLYLDDRLVGLAQFQCRRLAFYMGLASCSRGPVWAPDLGGELLAQGWRVLKQTIPTRAWRATVFSPDQTAEAMPPQAMRGLQRVMTGYSTVMLDLTRPLDDLRAGLEGKWRNRLVKAESMTGLQVHVRASVKDLQWLLERENLQRQLRGFQALPTDFALAYVDSHRDRRQAFVVASAVQGKQTLASMLFLIHGAVATYHVGWASEEGRSLNLHNLLLWRAIEQLKAQDVEQLDLGGVNTRALPGISRFKLGTGGRLLTLAGTYF
jgi:hypothetical protein